MSFAELKTLFWICLFWVFAGACYNTSFSDRLRSPMSPNQIILN